MELSMVNAVKTDEAENQSSSLVILSGVLCREGPVQLAGTA
jgi:hypothetical protein